MANARIHTDPVVPVAATLDFDGRPVRLLLIDDKIVFVANDAATALGYARPSGSVRTSVPAHQRRRVRLSAGHGGQRLTVLSVSGLHTLLDKSTMFATSAFAAWLAAQQIDGLREELAEAVEMPLNVKLFAAKASKPEVPKAQQRAVTPPIAHLLSNGVTIGVVLVEGNAWLVAKDVCRALEYRQIDAGVCLRNNRVAPELKLMARLSDAKGPTRSLLVHPDAIDGWMESALRGGSPGPRKTLAPAFMAHMRDTGFAFLKSVEAAHAMPFAAE